MSNTTSCLILAATCSFGMGLHHAAAQTIERVRLSDNDLSCTQIYAEVQQMDTVIQLAGPGLPAAQPQAANVPVPSPQVAAQIQASAYSNQAAINPQVQQMMANSNRADLRAASRDPAQVAQVAAMMQNPQMAVAAQRAAAAGVNPALIQSQLAAAGAAQQAAANAGANSGANLGSNLGGFGNLAGAFSGGAAPAAAPAPMAGLANMLGSGMAGQGGSAAGLAGMFGALAGMAAPAAPAPAPAAPVAPVAPAYTVQVNPPRASNAGMGAQARARKEHLTSLFLSRGCKLADVVR
ncbi:MAG: hypothetical protein H7228_01305 [Polaromonas sp.]|nr:hypothetical protein [Polaromonas sp.]